MRKVFVALVAILAAPAAYASCTWTATGASSVKVVCTTGNESAPTLVTEGLYLNSTQAISVVASADSGQTLSGAGTLQVYVYDPIVARWAPCDDCGSPAVSRSGIRDQAFAPFDVKVRRGGRVALIPVGVAVSSGGVTIYLSGEALR